MCCAHCKDVSVLRRYPLALLAKPRGIRRRRGSNGGGAASAGSSSARHEFSTALGVIAELAVGARSMGCSLKHAQLAFEAARGPLGMAEPLGELLKDTVVARVVQQLVALAACEASLPPGVSALAWACTQP